MSERVSMPALGESVTEGTVTRWLKNVGDSVAVDEPLLEVSTDKVDTEIPSPVAGVLLEILVQEDDVVEVGGDLCLVGEEGEASGSSDEGGAAEAQQPAEESDPEPQETSDATTGEETGGSSDADADAPKESSEQSSAKPSSSGGGQGGETVRMPALGESVTEGTVTRWLKAEGDEVAVDEPLLEVSTDKVDTEIPSPVAGVLTSILVQEDEVVEVGGDLCVVGGEATGDQPAAEAGSSTEDEGASSGPQESAGPKDEGAKDDDTQQDKGTAEQAEEKAQTAEAKAASGEGDLGEEKEVQEAAAQESAAKSDDGTASSDSEQDKDQTEDAVGLGTDSPENGSTSHKDTSGQPAPAGQDVSAYVTPLVRKLAAQHGVDLASLQGTGVGGRIRKQDVLDAAQAAKAPQAEPAPAGDQQTGGGQPDAPQSSSSSPASPAPAQPADSKRGTTEKMTRLRKVIATRMVESLQVSAQLTTVIEVDVTKIARLRKRAKDDFAQREGTKLSFMPFFAMAAIDALKAHPIVNASVEDDTIVYHAAEHLGVAVDTPRGLLVPVIKDAGDLNIAGLARKIADLADRTRDNKVGPDELSGGTFTLTNTGSRGALFDTPIINQPNVAILGTGAVVKRPVVVTDEDGGETIAIRDMVYLALSYDHRVVDGADAARFLVTMKERLEDGHFEV